MVDIRIICFLLPGSWDRKPARLCKQDMCKKEIVKTGAPKNDKVL